MAEKILIVDDDVQTLRLVGLMLERQGYKILAASNGTQAIGMARSEHPRSDPSGRDDAGCGRILRGKNPAQRTRNHRYPHLDVHRPSPGRR